MDARWLAANPLTTAELREEIRNWARLGIELAVPHATVHRATARIPAGTVEYADREREAQLGR